jgi:hypothetical protein
MTVALSIPACSGLRSLVLAGSKRLREDRLPLLTPLAPSLQRLSLAGCDRLGSGRHLSALTALTSLDVSRAQCPSTC